MCILKITAISTWLPFQCNALTPHWLHEKKTTCVWKHVNLALLWNRVLYEKTNTQLVQMHTFWHKSWLFYLRKRDRNFRKRTEREKKVGSGDTHRGCWGGGGDKGGRERGGERQTKPKVKKDGDDPCRHTNKRGKMGKEGRQTEKEMGQRQGESESSTDLQFGFCLTKLSTIALLDMTGLAATGSGSKLLFCCILSDWKHKCVLKTASHPTQCFSHLSRHHKNAHGCNNKQ